MLWAASASATLHLAIRASISLREVVGTYTKLGLVFVKEVDSLSKNDDSLVNCPLDTSDGLLMPLPVHPHTHTK